MRGFESHHPPHFYILVFIKLIKKYLLLFIITIFSIFSIDSVACFSRNNSHNLTINKNNTNSVNETLDSIIDNVDLNNYSEITSAITTIEEEVQTSGTQKRDAYYQRLFKGNFEKFDMYRDGGSIEIWLKDGTAIYQNFKIGSPKSELGKYSVRKPDGTVEYYNNNGKPIKNN